MHFENFQEKYIPIINNFLELHLKTEIEDKKFGDIISYSVIAGGKRLRPLLFLACLTTLNQKINESDIRTACGIELIHTYSLIHDDLPAMDNDDYRRGRLTSHKKWGEAEAILAGDALLSMGLEWILLGSHSADLALIMAKAIGPNGMVGGQYLDIDSTNNDKVKDDHTIIEKMEWLKTGCLLQACIEMAQKQVCGIELLNSQVSKALAEFSFAFGRSYQIYDDLVDVIETTKEAGKATNKDQEVGKNNTLTLLGLEESQIQLKKLINRGKTSVEIFDSPLLGEFFNIYQKVL